MRPQACILIPYSSAGKFKKYVIQSRSADVDGSQAVAETVKETGDKFVPVRYVK